MKLSEITTLQSKDSILALTALFILLYFFIRSDIILYFTFLLIFLCLLFPVVSRFLAWLWLSLSSLLGEFILKIVLIISFIVFVVPVGLLRRCIGKDSLGLKKWEKEKNTNFIVRNHLYSADDLKNPY